MPSSLPTQIEGFIERPGSNGPEQPAIEASLLTGGFDRPYVFGLATTLASHGVLLDIIGGDEVDRPELHDPPRLNFLNLRGNQRRHASLRQRMSRVLIYYARLMRYAAVAKPGIFHIIWNNKFQSFDRTLLMLYYKLLGKSVVFTAHNVNANRRDLTDTWLNRLTLRIQYRLADHIFVHTQKMKVELMEDFGVGERAIQVIPFGINNSVPSTALTRTEARCRLGIATGEKTILFFGRIGPYKGLDLLAAAFRGLADREPESYRLIIAGQPKKDAEGYLEDIRRLLRPQIDSGRVIAKIQYIPDEDTELYFKAADVLALPYTEVYQSGVLFLAYSFGIPVVATDVGSFRTDIVEGRTGFLCRPGDPVDLARALEAYFASDLYQHLGERGQEIRDYAAARNSWDVVGEITRKVYAEVSRPHKRSGTKPPN